VSVGKAFYYTEYIYSSNNLHGRLEYVHQMWKYIETRLIEIDKDSYPCETVGSSIVLGFSRESCSDASNDLRDCFINVGANLCECSGFDDENKPRGRGRTKVLTYLNIKSHGARGRMDDCDGFVFSNRVIREHQVIYLEFRLLSTVPSLSEPQILSTN
jgi:hypothetical protein